MTPVSVPPETLEGAKARAFDALTDVHRGMHVNDVKSRRHQDADAVVEAIAPLLFEAGLDAGREEARKAVERLIEERKAWVRDADADVESHFGETGRKLGQKAFQKNCEIAGLDEARAALVSLGKEGDGK